MIWWSGEVWLVGWFGGMDWVVSWVDGLVSGWFGEVGGWWGECVAGVWRGAWGVA